MGRSVSQPMVNPVWAVAVLLITGCAGKYTNDGAGGAGNDGGSGGASGLAGSGGGGEAGWGGGPTAFCPQGLPGSKLVAVESPKGWYCIDSDEALAEDYAKFLASGPSPDGLPQICAKKTSFDPSYPTKSGYPIQWVDWCDASAFCAWSGKRLCGALGSDAPVSFEDALNPFESEWMFTCSRGGQRLYPYGNTYVEMACIGADYLPGLAGPVKGGGGFGCEGGYAGIFNMVGNVGEWENSCKVGASPTCRIRGGNFNSSQEGLRCNRDGYGPPTERNIGLGIRCCADAQPTQ